MTAYGQAGLSLCWLHIPHCWKFYVAAHMVSPLVAILKHLKPYLPKY